MIRAFPASWYCEQVNVRWTWIALPACLVSTGCLLSPVEDLPTRPAPDEGLGIPTGPGGDDDGAEGSPPNTEDGSDGEEASGSGGNAMGSGGFVAGSGGTNG